MTSYGIAIPQVVEDGRFDGAGGAGLPARAEALGFESGWTQEQVLGDFPDLAPMETMAWAAAVTIAPAPRLRGARQHAAQPGCTSPSSIATVDQLSGGRLEVGIGTGGGYRQFAAFGVDPATYRRPLHGGPGPDAHACGPRIASTPTAGSGS